MPAEPLSDIEIQRELGGLSGWSRKGNAITKTYQFKTFPEGIAFVDRIAELAESAGHHPDIDIRYTKITCSLSTHDSGGITQKDLDLARAIEGADVSN
ncbi:MAG TPA: 4a-hydroxytetrahydrobiopterin dehydratase [Gemmatimonadaceae bacterium]|jgi:4a-hydroxytetrahydrobiopterin dehydratase|nr:4a-hydroxytetrahydrobiopterin dehydratase [Gemmatimonadaceae bacterium]